MRVPLLVSSNPNVLVFYYTGNGSATFDPSITTSAGVNVSWKPDDAPEAVTSGTTHNFSYTPSAGYHKCMVRVNGGLGLVTEIYAATDSITSAKNLLKIAQGSTIQFDTNASLAISTTELQRAIILYLSACNVSGPLSAVNRAAKRINFSLSTGISGSLSDVPSTVDVYCYLYGCTGIAPGSIGHLIDIRDIRLYSMWAAYTAADSVDIVINSMWAARADYTYSTPSLQIGGTNPAPTGNYIAPEEGTDWHLDGATWVPLTPNAKAYDLVNDVNDEGFNTCIISKN
jgi:hypothetical protein